MRFDTRGKMICLETQHFSLNRLLFLAIGLWPYHQTTFTRFQLMLFLSILASFILFQFTVLITESNFQRIIKVISSISFCTVLLIKYSMFSNVQTVKVAIEYLQHICNQLRDDNEIAIIRKYGNYTKHCTVGLILIATCCLFGFFCLPFWPYIIEVFLPINVSRSQLSSYITTEYFIDKERYFYLMLLHMDVAIFIGTFALVATGTMLIGWAEHIFAMFKIASYRIEQTALTIEILQSTNMENKQLICNKMILAIEMHHNAIKFSEYLLYIFEKPYLILISIGVSCLTFNLFRILSVEKDKSDVIVHFINVSGAIAYLFIANYMGQEITECNNHFFIGVYNVRWYIAPLPIQRMILFLLQKGNKPFQLTVGGLFSASLECFASLTSASISYFTVIYSIQR